MDKYSECIKTLQGMKINDNARTYEGEKDTGGRLGPLRIPNMIRWAARAGITLDEVDNLNIIHVSGTKGKGSTCAYCESILRHRGFKTGFFSSPHLVEVRERFRINGMPLSREKFVLYFMDVYNQLQATKAENNDSMPGAFGFLTVMAFHVFIKEQTDVAIMEVGLGGQYDATNMIRQPVVCGVASLGIDHIDILGDTIEKIAWHKAGIFKPGVPAFTAPQVPEALEVLQSRAMEISCTLKVIPNFSSYKKPGDDFELGMPGHMQTVNASLALQLTRTWIRMQGNSTDSDIVTPLNARIHYAKSFQLTEDEVNGLKQCEWPGRNQSIKKNNVTYYLDSAHTLESMQHCVQWFKKVSTREAESLSGTVVKILIFNLTGERDAIKLLENLEQCGFDGAAFVPNIPYKEHNSLDTENLFVTVTKEEQYQKCENYLETWRQLCRSKRKHTAIMEGHTIKLYAGENIESIANFTCIYDALFWATNGKDPCLKNQSELPVQVQVADHVQILVTGSTHLVGGVLGIVSDRYNI